ncbi:MAG: hypothetical protein HY321_09880 [Armatimonadetes bacterium]|nr:hypothetical protein [Armatimonadota bacterium]
MIGSRTRYEAYCDHCKGGVVSRDSLVMHGGQRLCTRCCQARQAAEARARRWSGRLLVLCSLAGAGAGYAVASGAGQLPYIGLFPGIIVGLIASGIIERRLKRH